MLLSSPNFILLFLPVAFFGYFLLNRARLVLLGKIWLVAVSLFFYACWNISALPILLSSIFFNFIVGSAVSKNPSSKLSPVTRRIVFISGIVANLVLLGFFKYANFFAGNVNALFHTGYTLPSIILPLGISFFTFTQIAYLVDSYRGDAKSYAFLSYIQFVTFFPYLIAGPILHHREMISQFESRRVGALRYRNIIRGLFIFSIGLFKKVIIAETFSIWANAGFDSTMQSLDFFTAWASSLSYTFQLYFDFSGYCDMGMGAALLFNIRLPINFNSPYKAMDIQDFWRRWHMTLSRYLRHYVYIPLGGNRCSPWHVYINLMATFLLGGLWHGASWMFVVWGSLHGAALVVHRIWSRFGIRMPKVLAWLLTFNFINIAWVFFRAKTMDDALRILRGMVDISSILYRKVGDLPTSNLSWGGCFSDYLLRWLPVGLAANFLCFAMCAIAFVIIKQKNSIELMADGNYGLLKLSGVILLFCIAMYAAMVKISSVFLYANF